MCEYTAVLDRFLTTRYPFQQAQAFLQAFIRRNVDEIGRWKAVLRDKNRSAVALDLGQ